MAGVFGILREDQVQQAPSDEPTVLLLGVPDDCQKRRSKYRCVGHYVKNFLVMGIDCVW
jgi:hypothetical protein